MSAHSFLARSRVLVSHVRALARYFREPNTAVTKREEQKVPTIAARTIDDRHPISFPSILANSSFNRVTIGMIARTCDQLMRPSTPKFDRTRCYKYKEKQI